VPRPKRPYPDLPFQIRAAVVRAYHRAPKTEGRLNRGEGLKIRTQFGLSESHFNWLIRQERKPKE
jgi:hypothetical protein